MLIGALQKFLLAQNDSILHLFLEVWAYGVTSDVLDPQPQLLFFLRVILLSNLGGWRGQGSRVTKGKRENCAHSFSSVAILDTRSWETTLHLRVSAAQTKMINQSGKTDRFVGNPVCFAIVPSFIAAQIQQIMLFLNYLKPRAHTGISCLAKSPLPLKSRKFVCERFDWLSVKQ